ncbi:MAG: hypothetical protein WDZ80_03770 [Candidatus Paceibacterota bacterium]
MIKKRLVLSISIILLGIIVSFFLINKSEQVKPSLTISSQENKIDPSLNFDSETDKIKSRINSITNKSVNLTDALGNEYLKNIAENNPDGPTEMFGEYFINFPELEKINVNSEEFDQVLNEIFKIEKLSRDDIKILEDNSKLAQKEYLRSLGDLINENFSNINKSEITLVNDWLYNQSTDGLRDYIQSSKNQITGMIELQVPEIWVEFHLDWMNLFLEKIVVYDSFLKDNTDPLRAILALEKSANLNEKSSEILIRLEKGVGNLFENS